jgi:hypothetical protein
VATEASAVSQGDVVEGRHTGDSGADRQRVQIEFTPEVSARLREIKQMAGVKTNADVVRNALRLFDWFLKQRQGGWQLQLVKGDTVREVEVIF